MNYLLVVQVSVRPLNNQPKLLSAPSVAVIATWWSEILVPSHFAQLPRQRSMIETKEAPALRPTSANEKMAKILKTTTFKGTWLGKNGIATTHHLDSKSDGLRIVVYQIEGDPIKVDLIKGDGRFSDGRFQTFRSAIITIDAVEATVNDFAASA